MKKIQKLEKEVRSNKKNALRWLEEHGSVRSARSALSRTQLGDDIRKVNHLTEYDGPIAKWALEHDHADLLDALLATLKPVTYLSVFNNKDYQCIREFVRQSLELSPQQYESMSHDKRQILQRLASVDSELVDAYLDPKIMRVVHEEISHAKTKRSYHSAGTLSAFKTDLEATSAGARQTRKGGASLFFSAEKGNDNKKTVSFEIDSQSSEQNLSSQL